MFVIRTANEMTRALSSSLDPTLLERLACHRNHLLDYPDYTFEELGAFIIVEPGDRLEDLNQGGRYRMVEDGAFVVEPETVDYHNEYLELLVILSDDGFGLIVFVSLMADIDRQLLSACQALAPDLQLPADH